MRLKLCLAPEARAEKLKELVSLGFQDMVYLYTCNRVEFYTTGKDYFADSRPLWMKLLAHLGLSEDDYYRGYQLEGKSAVRHLLRVACSLESLVVGEPQILGQLKDAVRFSKEAGIALDGSTEKAFTFAFETAKKVRTATAIGEKPVSVATLGLQQLQKLERELPLERAVVVGRSPISRIIVQWLSKKRPNCPILWVNRNLETLRQIPESKLATLMPLSDFLARPPAFSHLFTATAATEIVFDAAFFEKVQGARKLVFDFAQPPDVEKSEATLSRAVIHSLEDFAEEARVNAVSRAKAVAEAETIIESALREHCLVQKQAPILRDFNAIEPRFLEELEAASAMIEKEFPAELHAKLKTLAEKIVKRNLHCSREHLRAILSDVAEPGSGTFKVL